MDNSVIARKNIVSGMLKVAISILLPFFVRTAMIYSLGKEYLGLNSLFTSILSILNLAELGFSNAIIFCMYEPIAKGNTEKVCALLNLYKKIYYIIGSFVLTGGLLIMPFIGHFIKGSWPEDINIFILFVIYLFNSSISYFFFAYKSALLNALKRVDIINNVQSAVYFFQYTIQIIMLCVFKNYYIYIIFTPLFTIIINLLIAGISKKKYPQFKCAGDITTDEKEKVFTSVKSIVLYRISEITRNSLDTIIISSFFGLAVVAVYNNYYYVFTAVYSMVIAINQSIQAIIGQNIVIKSKEDNLKDLRKFNFISLWIISWCSITMISLYQPFMLIWVGKDMCFPFINAVLFGVYFYVLNMNNIKNLYFDGCGLWPKGKWSYTGEIIGNLLLNIMLGKLFGTTGIIIATIITIFVFSFVYRTNILFREFFETSALEFYKDNLKHAVIACLVGFFTITICCITGSLPPWKQFLLNGIICVFIPNACFAVLFRNIEYFKFYKQKIIERIRGNV